jgi:hypothetical protein
VANDDGTPYGLSPSRQKTSDRSRWAADFKGECYGNYRNQEAQADARYHNVTGDDEAARWSKIGAAWAHRDSNGFSLSLEYLPRLAGGRLVIRAFPVDEAR